MQKPFAFFERHPVSNIWQEVVPSAAGEKGVVAAYLEGAATQPVDPQPDDQQWVSDQHVAIKTHHTHEFGEGQSTLHPDAISDALRQGLERGRATGVSVSLPVLQEALEQAEVTTGLSEHCENIDAAVFTGDTLHDDEKRAELKAYVGRWAGAIAAHEGDGAEEGAAAVEEAVVEPVVEPKNDVEMDSIRADLHAAHLRHDVQMDSIHAALRAAGLTLINGEHGLVIEKTLDAVAEDAAPVAEPVQVDVQAPAPALVEVSRLEQVGWSYTEAGADGKKYLKRDRQDSEKVGHMVEAVLYEGQSADHERALAEGATLVLAKSPEAAAEA